MTANTAKSFGAQLLKGQSLVTYINGFTNFNPPRVEESVGEMTTLVNKIYAANASEIVRLENYLQATEARAAAFRKKDGSVERLIPAIRGAVESQYGKPSRELSTLDIIIRRMRPLRHTAPVSDPANTDASKTISQSERSYGSVTQFFNDIINCLSQFTGYVPANDALKVASLQAHAQLLGTLNNNVSLAIQLLQTERLQRIALYKELDERVKRIKAYVKSEYGLQSSEAQLIARLKY
ncbi:MAG: hypothetical protein WCM76_10525 [Bacteroidota bacterium]